MVKGELATLKPLKILFIGNSYSQDTFTPLAEVFYAEGKTDYVFGLCFEGGSSAQRHAENITNNYARYEYYESKPNSTGAYSTPFGTRASGDSVRVTMDKILQQQDWDYVFIQTSPAEYVDNTMFASERDQIATHVKELRPNAKIGYSCSWLAPYSDDKTRLQNCTGNNKVWYDAMVAKAGTDTEAHYQMLYNAITQNILTDTTYSTVLPACTPVAYASRTVGMGSDELYRDLVHLSDFGRVLVAYMFYAQLMKDLKNMTALSAISLKKYNQTLSEETLALTAENKAAILNSVNYALQTPWTLPTKIAPQSSEV
jgi:hypothetical protein